jgi:hypothetical protein
MSVVGRPEPVLAMKLGLGLDGGLVGGHYCAT